MDASGVQPYCYMGHTSAAHSADFVASIPNKSGLGWSETESCTGSIERQLVRESTAHVCKNAPVSEHEQHNHSRTLAQDCHKKKERFNIDVLPRPLFVSLSVPASLPPLRQTPSCLHSRPRTSAPRPHLSYTKPVNQSVPKAPEKSPFNHRPDPPRHSLPLISSNNRPVVARLFWGRGGGGGSRSLFFLPPLLRGKRNKIKEKAEGPRMGISI